MDAEYMNWTSPKMYDNFPAPNLSLQVVLIRTRKVILIDHSWPNIIGVSVELFKSVRFLFQVGLTLVSLCHQMMVKHGSRIYKGKHYPLYSHRLKTIWNTCHQVNQIRKEIIANKQDRPYINDIPWYRCEPNAERVMKQSKLKWNFHNWSNGWNWLQSWPKYFVQSKEIQ